MHQGTTLFSFLVQITPNHWFPKQIAAPGNVPLGVCNILSASASSRLPLCSLHPAPHGTPAPVAGVTFLQHRAGGLLLSRQLKASDGVVCDKDMWFSEGPQRRGASLSIFQTFFWLLLKWCSILERGGGRWARLPFTE